MRIREERVSESAKMRVWDKINAPVVIEPGEFAQYLGADLQPEVGAGDIDRLLAWKNGFFMFEGSPIEDVMEVMSRWYGIEVHYEGPQPMLPITGTIPNDTPLLEVLEILQDTGADAVFTVNADTLTVRKLVTP